MKKLSEVCEKVYFFSPFFYFTNPQPNSVGILYFSDPNNTYNGYSLGTSQDNNTILVQNIICENTSFTSPPDIDPIFYQASSQLNESKEILVYPNPGKNSLYISTKEALQMVELTSKDGKILKKTGSNAQETLQSLHIGDLTSGLYLLTVKTTTHTEVLKFIKQ